MPEFFFQMANVPKAYLHEGSPRPGFQARREACRSDTPSPGRAVTGGQDESMPQGDGWRYGKGCRPHLALMPDRLGGARQVTVA